MENEFNWFAFLVVLLACLWVSAIHLRVSMLESDAKKMQARIEKLEAGK